VPAGAGRPSQAWSGAPVLSVLLLLSVLSRAGQRRILLVQARHQAAGCVRAQGFQATDVVAGAGEALPDGGWVWRMRVRSPGAESLLLLFRCGPGSTALGHVSVVGGASGCCARM